MKGELSVTYVGIDVSKDKLVPDMNHAANLVDIAGPVDFFEPGVAVGVHPALIAGEMTLGVLALPVGREPKPTGRGASPYQGRSSRPAGAACQNLSRCVVCKDRLSRVRHCPNRRIEAAPCWAASMRRLGWRERP